MPKITDPDLFQQGVNVNFITSSSPRLIQLIPSGALTASLGYSVQALYSFAKEEWRTDDNLVKFPFPFTAITAEQFDLINNWDLSGSNSITDPSSSKAMARDAGWSRQNTAGNSVEEWMNITTLGSFNDAAVDTAYFEQSSSRAVTSSILPGEVNQGIQIYASASGQPEPNYNFRDYFKIFLREQSKIYDSYDLLTEQNLGALTYRKYALPLQNSNDLKIEADDGAISTGSIYSGMSITYYATNESRSIGGTIYPFSVIINGNSGTAEQIYEFVQYQLRQSTDIDAGAGSVIGEVADELLEFVGDTLTTKLTSQGGVYIDNFQAADTNRLEFTDDSGSSPITFPFVAAGNILSNDTLANDTNGVFRVFFTNDDAGDNTGRDFGTQTAILINDNSNNPITGAFQDFSTSGSIGFDFDFDGNIQRGNASSGSPAPYTAVALGLSSAQYVITTGTISRSTSNVINFVAALERVYLNE